MEIIELPLYSVLQDVRVNLSAPASLHTSQESLNEGRGGAAVNVRGGRYAGHVVDEGLGTIDPSTLSEKRGHMDTESVGTSRK